MRSYPCSLVHLDQMDKMNTGKRIKNPKPWTGCQTCKQKYLRCYEKESICPNCIRYGRVCDNQPPPDTKDAQSPHADDGESSSRPSSASQAHVLPPTDDQIAGVMALTSTSVAPSLDPYPESLLPLTPARRALLAFCEICNLPFLVRPGLNDSPEAD